MQTGVIPADQPSSAPTPCSEPEIACPHCQGSGKLVRGSVSTNPQLSDPALRKVLTAREQQVMRLVAGGKSTREAAVILGISAKTLDKHRTSMMQKLGLHNAAAVTRYAITVGLVSLEVQDRS